MADEQSNESTHQWFSKRNETTTTLLSELSTSGGCDCQLYPKTMEANQVQHRYRASSRFSPTKIMIEEVNSYEKDTESLLPSAPPPTSGIVQYCGGRIQAERVGNMTILFPERFRSGKSSWGVVGPSLIGPFCVWMILCTASYFVVKRAMVIGPITTFVCCALYVISTFNLLNVVLRDPGICFYKAVPDHLPANESKKWMWNDRCQVYHPPGGRYCSNCDVCIEEYDHFCMWMGTTIGKKNYQQFMIFNGVWLIYLFYFYFWIIIFHLAPDHSDDKK